MKAKVLVMFSLVFLSGCAVEPEVTTFVLVNGGEADIYHNDEGWLGLTADGRPASLVAPSCLARCGALQGRIACIAAARIPAAHRVRVGESTELSWDGTYYEVDSERGCYREHRRDAEFVATFCYGSEVDIEETGIESGDDDVIVGGWVSDPVCEQVAFERGGEVELIAE